METINPLEVAYGDLFTRESAPHTVRESYSFNPRVQIAYEMEARGDLSVSSALRALESTWAETTRKHSIALCIVELTVDPSRIYVREPHSLGPPHPYTTDRDGNQGPWTFDHPARPAFIGIRLRSPPEKGHLSK